MTFLLLLPLNQASTWADVAMEATRLLIPALIALGGTWLALRSQRLLKKIEIDAQTKLKARELLFDIKKQHLARFLESGQSLLKTLGEVTGSAAGRGDIEESRTMLTFALDFIRLVNIEAVEHDLTTIGYLTDGHRRDLELIREVRAINPKNIPSDGIYPAFLKIADAVTVIQELRAEILESLCYGIFKEYLPSIKENPSFAPGLRPANPNQQNHNINN